MSDVDYRAELYRRLQRLRLDVQADLESVAVLRAVAKQRDEIARLTSDLDHQLERLPRAAVVTLVGATGAGKSALLNALVGGRIANEGVDRPTTREPVVYAPHDADLSVLLGAITPPPRVVRYDRSGGPWTTQVLIDAPDVNSVAVEHRATVDQLAERSDVLLVVLHRQSVVEQASVSFIDLFAARRRLIFVLNRIDEVSDDARDSLLAQARAMASTRWSAADAPVIATSAKLAQQQPNAPGWRELCDVLNAMVRDSAIAGVRRLNAVGTAASIERLLREVDAEIADDLEALPAETGDGVIKLAQRVGEEVATRLQLRRADVAAILLAEAAKRWDGPGGWALRVGGVSALGIGAGALLARRHPLLATGAAAGSVAATQAHEALQRQRTAEVDGLLPVASEFASWYAEALAAPRLRAVRLVQEPEHTGLPSAASLRAETAVAVEEAWDTFIARDLPVQAQRSALRFFHVPLDLPVYALGAWVVYRVADGFLSGRYTGTDFLVNALLLLGAYLLLTSFIIRRALSWRAGRMLNQITSVARAAVNDRGEDARHAVGAITQRMRDALQRLAHLSAAWRERLGS
jgi:GTPase Era involved in 16S rRNA processing